MNDTFDEEMAYAEQSGLHQCDRDFQRTFREEIDKMENLLEQIKTNYQKMKMKVEGKNFRSNEVL